MTTYLQLEGDALRQYEAMLAERRHREIRAMIMTWEEKKIEQGRQEGKQEGRQEGMRELVLRQLGRRFAPLPAAVARRVTAMASLEELTNLADRLLDARSLDELGLA